MFSRLLQGVVKNLKFIHGPARNPQTQGSKYIMIIFPIL